MLVLVMLVLVMLALVMLVLVMPALVMRVLVMRVLVMPGLGPGIHDFPAGRVKSWMAGPSPAMTKRLRP
jgi:hypothetical protein